MSDLAPAPQDITMAMIREWSPETMRRYMAGPLRMTIIETIAAAEQARINGLQQTVVPDADQPIVAEPVVDTAEQERLAAAEQQRLQAEQEAARKAAETPKKLVIEYQVTDENGQPIGRPTHLEAATNEELIEKMKNAHIHATRAFHRLKSQKVTSLREANQQQAAQTPVVPTMTDAELLAAVKELKSDDPQVVLEAHRKINAKEITEARAAAEAQVAVEKEQRRQENVSHTFLRNHVNDFNPCEANVKLMADYFKDNQLPWTLDNLEIALHALESELAPVVQQVTPVVPNPAPTTVVVPTTAAVTPVQATPTAVVTPVTPANSVPVARPGVNGGIQPGQNSGSRPAGTSTGLTTDEIRSWDAKTMREKMRNPQLRSQIEAVIAANPRATYTRQ